MPRRAATQLLHARPPGCSPSAASTASTHRGHRRRRRHQRARRLQALPEQGRRAGRAARGHQRAAARRRAGRGRRGARTTTTRWRGWSPAHAAFALSEPELIRVQDRDLANLSRSDGRAVRRLQRAYVEVWVGALTPAAAGPAAADARTAAHAALRPAQLHAVQRLAAAGGAAGDGARRPAPGGRGRTSRLGPRAGSADDAQAAAGVEPVQLLGVRRQRDGLALARRAASGRRGRRAGRPSLPPVTLPCRNASEPSSSTSSTTTSTPSPLPTRRRSSGRTPTATVAR